MWRLATSTQSLVYDADGRKSAQYDQLNRPTFFFYDGLGRLTAVSNILNQVTKYAYDEVGNQTNQTDALNRQTTYQYDALGRRTKRTLPGTQYETFIYDAVGNVLVHSNFNGLAITNTYDSMNRLSSRSNGTTRLEYYVYDVAGQLTNRIDTSGNYTWVFDNRGRVTTNTTPVGTLHYGYDADGNQTNLSSTTSGGVNLRYQYDAFNRLTNVLDVNLGLSVTNTAYTYDAVGNLQTMKYPNGVTNLWQYDSLNRLTNLVSKHNSTPLGSFYYQLGPTGIRTNLSETVSSTNRNFAWQYDSIYRLTNETISAAPMGSISYGYDAVGKRTNRSSGITNLSPQTFTYNSNDWISTDGYDSNGNTTTNSSNQIYKYDYTDRLTNFNGGAVTIVYDADGNRIQKITAAANILYLVSGVNPTGHPQVVEEFAVSVSTNLTKVYTYGLSLISQRVPGANTNFFGFDGHGSTRFLTDAAGNLANAFAYDAYGTLIASNSTPPTAYLYCGEQFDSDLGFYYLRARYVNPNSGRFWTTDTFEGNQVDPVALHKYLYCRANPVNGTDPRGHDLISLSISTSIGTSLDAIYNGAVLSVDNALQRTIIGVQNGETAKAILGGYLNDIGTGVEIGVGIGATVDIVGDLIYSRSIEGELVEIEVNGANTVEGSRNFANVESTTGGLMDAAGRAAKAVKNETGQSQGAVYGTKVHTKFRNYVRAMGLRSEISYLEGKEVDYGTPGSIRVDAVKGAKNKPEVIGDLKTGTAKLTPERVRQIRSHLPDGYQDIPIEEIRP